MITPEKVCIVYRDHNNNDFTKNRFEEMKSDFIESNIDIIHYTQYPTHFYETYEPAKVSTELMNNTEIYILNFFLENPNYDFYFHMDWDVFYYGNMSHFLNDIMKNEFDFLSTYIYTDEEFKNKFNIPNLWISKPNNFPKNYTLYTSFIPFNGYSKKFLEFLHLYYTKNKIPAFCEISLPTLAINNNFKIFDLEKTKYIDKTTFTGEGVKVNKANMLYHHIKK